MRVKRLEIQGFKSFKDKTVIHFDHGITGIVGPNGCGKSNIVDAFFWVMGEQSYKHMRGSGSEDLIFNGSSKYTPLGVAEATLVMEAAMVDTAAAPSGATSQDVPLPMKTREMAVTRRVYRTGEGEYFINGVQARLKDIQELFMDTGVGAKGYSVIEQGQIDKVVNSKPEDRRLLIEEAAGIAKYKARKKESLRKLEAAQANLSRLNDVLAEIERSLGSLERQAQKARKYREYKDALFEKEISWGRRKAKILEQQMQSYRSKKEALEQEILALKTELHTAETSIETDRIQQLTDTKESEVIQALLQDLTSDLGAEKGALELSKARQEDLKRQISSLTEEEVALSRQLDGDRSQLVDRENTLAQLKEEQGQSDTQCRAMDEQVRTLREEARSARDQLDHLKATLLLGVSQASELTSRSASLLARAEASQIQVQRLLEREQEVAAKLGEAQTENERTHIVAQELRQKKEILKQSEQTQSQNLRTLEETFKQREKERNIAQKELTQLNSRLTSLEELAAAREGFADGPKAILDWAKSSHKEGSFRVIADLFEVERGFEHALEGLLEGRLQDLLAKDVDEALEALKLLKEGQQGRAAIHLMQAQPDYKPREGGASFDALNSLLTSFGFEVMGELSRFVRLAVPGEVPALAMDWTQNTCVVRSMDPLSALIHSQKIGELQGWGLVSLDGLTLGSAGELKGGSTESDSTASILGRKRAIQDLKDQVQNRQAVFETIESEVSEIQSRLIHDREAHRVLVADLQSTAVQAAAIERDVQIAGKTLADLTAQLEKVRADRILQEEQGKQSQLERERMQSELNSLLSQRAEVETQIQGVQQVSEAKEIEVKEQEAILQALKLAEVSLQERLQSQQRELVSAKNFLIERERRQSEIQKLLERVTQERAHHTGGDQAMEEKISLLAKRIADEQGNLSMVKDRLEQCSARVNSNLGRIKELHAGSESKASESNTLALELEKLNSEMAHLKQNLEEKYGANCFDQPVATPIQEEMAAPVITAEMTEEEERNLAEEVESLRERIRRLGEVNTMAIEEYEDLKKRYDHLIDERTDLEKSIENLQAAIEHINKTSEERFRKAFEAIANRFERLFPIIFGGGQARLSLVYPEGSTDILEAGVDILAQPPGKKVVNITLLSGGEKALTAISLVFAIFMVKPSPFCVLDEVDAPLDDSNIGKFNALLREMAVKSQFIVITHNKKTMELNDTLYGVTMEEPGVSKMVSIELR